MPGEPLIDVARLDLERVAARRAEIERCLPHRGRFFMLDAVLERAPDDPVCVGYKEIRADDWWAPDHIPGRPLFPGVLMIESAAQLASYDFVARHDHDPNVFLGFGGTGETRFRGRVEPPTRLVLAVRALRVRKTLFQYAAQGFREGELVFETEILGLLV